MNAPHMETKDKVISFNGPAGIVALIVGCLTIIGVGYRVATAFSQVEYQIETLNEDQVDRHSETMAFRREVEVRLRALETARATDGADLAALRRDLTAFRDDIRQLNELLRQIEQRLGGRP